ncbi:2-methylaconitate cis-trans isomerase PrpF [Pseudoalteromonas luteoviolacea]|uniref:3-methylitaconate isomerase n=1 Tax=Pseudoalteromonas luteoviolacea NCIMB 1942 TaxID=1365253 RepID=A0A166Z591_9GAMM|nr:2-methylaconitate cis-trans isomerase PrpF [Pseudoalteromonas luteoviolacea]KZN43856.1 3-methylitaconate isomerase [Pseudoalteromonas luteoviolacea NCIMB 1942]KZX01541.1 3-methylitaconate isomerase [Pseudoalteromonas luteoviolacea]
MSFKPQIKIPATYMRGGTSKGVFFKLDDLPQAAQKPGEIRDQILLRVIGSPDPYAKQTDGMGGATSSTSKTVILSKSSKPDHDVDYLFGQVAIDKPFIDWSGNCGNLTAAVGAFAISNGLVSGERIPKNGVAVVRIWQANIGKTIVAHIPITNGEVQETGDFELDGVTFPAAEVVVEFLDPADANADMFPSGNLVDTLEVPDIGSFDVTMINAGIPTLFFRAQDLSFDGTELQEAVNGDAQLLARMETIRAHGALKMGLISTLEEAKVRQHTPKIAFVSGPQQYLASSGKAITEQDIDLCVRALSMGKLHHAMMGTAAVAIATAGAIPGTLVNQAAGGGNRTQITFGHPSGTLKVGAEAQLQGERWLAKKAIMSRSARVLMEGTVRIPDIL